MYHSEPGYGESAQTCYQSFPVATRGIALREESVLLSLVRLAIRRWLCGGHCCWVSSFLSPVCLRVNKHNVSRRCLCTRRKEGVLKLQTLMITTACHKPSAATWNISNSPHLLPFSWPFVLLLCLWLLPCRTQLTSALSISREDRRNRERMFTQWHMALARPSICDAKDWRWP